MPDNTFSHGVAHILSTLYIQLQRLNNVANDIYLGFAYLSKTVMSKSLIKYSQWRRPSRAVLMSSNLDNLLISFPILLNFALKCIVLLRSCISDLFFPYISFTFNQLHKILCYGYLLETRPGHTIIYIYIIYIYHTSAQNIDCGYSLEPPRLSGSNEYLQSMVLSRNKKK